jgi:hypothetical protein
MLAKPGSERLTSSGLANPLQGLLRNSPGNEQTLRPPLMSNRRVSIERYLQSGEHDPYFAAWSGGLMARARLGHAELKRALIEAVEGRVAGLEVPETICPRDQVSLTRSRVEPMVRGLFPRREQEQVLGVLERSIVFLTPKTIRQVLEDAVWLHTAWALANLYLGSVGAELLSEEAPRIVGLSEETTCYVSLEYLTETDRFSDYVVHETAHVFHNCKRETIGLEERRGREWLLDIDFGKRELFAHSCEAYSRILVLAARGAERRRLVEEAAADAPAADGRVDAAEFVDILREAVAARNGWKRILARCAPAPRRKERCQ